MKALLALSRILIASCLISCTFCLHAGITILNCFHERNFTNIHTNKTTCQDTDEEKIGIFGGTPSAVRFSLFKQEAQKQLKRFNEATKVAEKKQRAGGESGYRRLKKLDDHPSEVLFQHDVLIHTFFKHAPSRKEIIGIFKLIIDRAKKAECHKLIHTFPPHYFPKTMSSQEVEEFLSQSAQLCAELYKTATNDDADSDFDITIVIPPADYFFISMHMKNDVDRFDWSLALLHDIFAQQEQKSLLILSHNSDETIKMSQSLRSRGISVEPPIAGYFNLQFNSGYFGVQNGALMPCSRIEPDQSLRLLLDCVKINID